MSGAHRLVVDLVGILHPDGAQDVDYVTARELTAYIHANYVERPRWHEHDDGHDGRYGHDHDGHALFHEHRHRYVDYGGGQFFRRTTDPQRAAS